MNAGDVQKIYFKAMKTKNTRLAEIAFQAIERGRGY